MRTFRLLAAVAAVSAAAACPAFGAFDITINYTTAMTPSQLAAFAAAEQAWESRLVDYKPGITGISGVTISASAPALDGVGGLLGQAGPTSYSLRTASNSVQYALALTGVMEFDSADLGSLESGGSLGAVIEHEMGHVLGFGTLWSLNNIYVNGSGQYTGAQALAAYRYEFNQPAALYVPVELEGGDGTANGHWNELNFGSGPTGLTDLYGRDMYREVMTGWLNTPVWVSNTTIQSFGDIGYAVPEPGVVGLGALIGLCGLSLRKRAKRSA